MCLCGNSFLFFVYIFPVWTLAFGGAAAIRKTPDTPFHRCVNYYAVNDPLLFVVPSAEKALRSGYVADEEFCFLAPLVGDPSADHGLLNPTYVRALSWEGQKFQRNYQSLVYRSSRSFILFCLAVIKTILLKIRAAIKFILHSLLFMREWLSKIFEAPLFQYCHDHFLRPLIKPVLRLAIYVAFLFEKLRAAYETLFNSRDVGKSKIASGDENNAGVN